jgi:hypothetical protein
MFCGDMLETLFFSRLFSKFVSKFSKDGDMLETRWMETRWRHVGDVLETCMKQQNMPSYKPMKTQVLKPLPDMQAGLLTAKEL